MPAVPHQASHGHAPQIQPRNPNLPPKLDRNAHAISSIPFHQPSPAVLDTSSHSAIHALPRRFLGPLPPEVTQSTDVQAKQSRLHRVRLEALQRINGVLEAGGSRKGSLRGALEGENDEGRIRGKLQKIKVLRRGRFGEDIEEEFEFDPTEIEGEDGDLTPRRGLHLNRNRNKGKGKGKERWDGESFDIGREFTTSSRIFKKQSNGSEDGQPLVEEPEDRTGTEDRSAGPSRRTKRPKITPKSTQESFVTARTTFTQSLASSTSHLETPSELRNRDQLGSSASVTSLVEPAGTRHSQSSSSRPLLGKGADDSLGPNPDGREHDNTAPGDTGSKRLKRLKSAIRKPGLNSTLTMPPLSKNSPAKNDGMRSKSVTFPVDPASIMGERRVLQPGDKPPEDPEAVLAREGSEAEGTSAGAQESALEEEEWDEIDNGGRMNDVIMRDRMLVKVGYHRDESLHDFDEAKQRRSPCVRMEPFEEYIVVYRLGRIELYQEWGNPVRARVKGTLRLCFIVLLSPTRTSMSVFHEADMSISLCTSASKLQTDIDIYTERRNSRARVMKDRIAQSKQAQWLRNRERGSHVVIFKLGERSRALDWYWEIWRELGNQLPKRFDVLVPSLSTSVRVQVPEDKFEVGGVEVLKHLKRDQLVKRCWEMIYEAVDVDDLLSQRSRGKGEKLDLELAWKSIEGSLEWIAYGTTVEGRPRDWAVLAGLAKLTSEKVPRELQLRVANHQPSDISLETGTQLTEPPGIEGYLTRHKSSTSPRERVYIASHDGNMYTSTITNAQPPLPPQRESSIPADLFPEVHREFMDGERRRIARFIERSAGCIDMRNIDSVTLCSQLREPKGGVTDMERWQRSFEVTLPTAKIQFEAHEESVAKEWVERLQSLMDYWKRRHRVDARLRMDAMAMHAANDPFAGTQLSNSSDELLSDVWDWCVIKGCRGVSLSGRLFMRKKAAEKFQARYIVLTGGSLVTFKIQTKQSFFPRQHHYPLFGAYAYSGMLAQEDVRETTDENALAARARVYQDGLQSSDGTEDTTFCVRLVRGKQGWGRNRPYPWEIENEPEPTTANDSVHGTQRGSKAAQARAKTSRYYVPPLTTSAPQLLIFRARSKLERDRWIWAINAEMERLVRANPEAEAALRNTGTLP